MEIGENWGKSGVISYRLPPPKKGREGGKNIQ
jgi:hypothetical protein